MKSTVLCFLFCTWKEGCVALIWFRVNETHSSWDVSGKNQESLVTLISSYGSKWMALPTTGSSWGYYKRTRGQEPRGFRCTEDDRSGNLWFACCACKFSRWWERETGWKLEISLADVPCLINKARWLCWGEKNMNISCKALCPWMGWRLCNCWEVCVHCKYSKRWRHIPLLWQ